VLVCVRRKFGEIRSNSGRFYAILVCVCHLGFLPEFPGDKGFGDGESRGVKSSGGTGTGISEFQKVGGGRGRGVEVRGGTGTGNLEFQKVGGGRGRGVECRGPRGPRGLTLFFCCAVLCGELR
jgi:hypothetical protein